MKELLEDLLAAEAEAQRVVDAARGEADSLRRKAVEEVEAYRRARRAESEQSEAAVAGAAREQAAEEEKRIGAAGDNEVAALRRRFEERKSALAETLVRMVVPKT